MKNLFTLFLISMVFSTVILSGCEGVKHKVKSEPFEYIITEEIDQINEKEEMDGSIWTSNKGLFADRRAKNVNDIVTVNIVESSSATRKAATSTGRDTEINGGVSSLFGLEQAFQNHRFDPSNMLSLEASKSFKGDGSTERSGNLTGTITAIVKEVYPNGVMRIEGRRVITVNNEDQYIIISGLVRRDDIAVNNTILSTKVAEAVIEYSGEGIIGREQSPGFLTQIIDVIWPF